MPAAVFAADGVPPSSDANRRCSLELADCDGLEHGCRCTAAGQCKLGFECNAATSRCFTCPRGEFGCHHNVNDTCFYGLECINEKCVGTFNGTIKQGTEGQECFSDAPLPYLKCQSKSLRCGADGRCVKCSATPLAELGCACTTHADCGDKLLCDSGSGTCAACISGCVEECSIGQTVQNASIAIALSLTFLVIVALIAGFVVQRRRS